MSTPTDTPPYAVATAIAWSTAFGLIPLLVFLVAFVLR